ALLELGQIDLRETGARAGAHEAEVVRDLRQADGERLQRARDLDEAVPRRLGLERVRRGRDLEAAVRAELRAHTLSELGMRDQPRADSGAAERDLAQPAEGRLDPRLAL